MEESGLGRRKCRDWIQDILGERCLLDLQVEASSRSLDMNVRFREAQSDYIHLEIIRV